MWQPNAVLGTDDASTLWNVVGKKQYELTNHLGNVMATISDRRLQLTSDNTTVSGYDADVINAQEYYVFGGIKPGLTYSVNSASYRYGFNGKENDNEVKGTGNWQDYGMRDYDPRVGRFPSVDPLTKDYAALTPYQFASNSPVAGNDRDGLEFVESGAYATMKNREYESQLRKSDPKNADAIIRQHNIDAFLFVGGALTAGSGSAATAFWDLAGGTARTLQGVANHDKTQVNEGVHVVTSVAMAEVGGFVFSKALEIASPLLSEIPVMANVKAKFVSSNDINITFTQQNWYAPYKANTTLAELDLPTEVSGLVRLSGPNNVKGNWFTTMQEIKGLSPAQLKDKFALKFEPTSLTPVSIKGNVRVGEAAKIDEFGAGGGFQIETLPGSSVSYGKTVPLK